MAFSILAAGAANMRIYVQKPCSRTDGTGNEVDDWEDIYANGIQAIWRRKTTRYDAIQDSRKDDSVFAAETAAATVRYTRKITSDCRVRCAGDNGGWWYIIGTPERSVDGGWLAFTAERKRESM